MPLSSAAAAAATSTSLLTAANVSPNSNFTNTGLATSNNFEYTTTNIPAFLSKLWTLVEDERYNELIAWDPVRAKTFLFFLNRVKVLIILFESLLVWL